MVNKPLFLGGGVRSGGKLEGGRLTSYNKSIINPGRMTLFQHHLTSCMHQIQPKKIAIQYPLFLYLPYSNEN